MVPEAGETLPVFAQRLEHRWPALAGPLNAFVAHYQQQRFASTPGRAERREAQRLGRVLRRSLRTGNRSKEAVQREHP
jgi:hypothetical protein